MEDAVFMQNRNHSFGVFLYEYCIFFFMMGAYQLQQNVFLGQKIPQARVRNKSEKKKRQVQFCIFGQVCYIPWMRYLVRKPVKGLKKPHETKTKNGEHRAGVPPLTTSAVKMQS